MGKFDLETAINKLRIKSGKAKNKIDASKMPMQYRSKDLVENFLPYLIIVGDSREQNRWIEKACDYYGIKFDEARKGNAVGNLKEGDYTFVLNYESTTFNYIGKVAFERKGTLNELWGNLTGDRERIEKEFKRLKNYDKVVLMIEYGKNINDLLFQEFEFLNKSGEIEKRNTKNVIYSALMSWSQPNRSNFKIIQSNNHEELFWQMINEMYYYFRNDIKEIWEKANG